MGRGRTHGSSQRPGLREAADLVAERFGFTPDAFLKQPLNLGYDGAMPADHCAAGLAHAIVHAPRHHGETAEAITTLLRAAGSGRSVPESVAAPAAQVAADLRAFDGELARAGVFGGAMTLRALRDATGRPVGAWTRVLDGLVAAAEGHDPVELTGLREAVRRLADHYAATAGALDRWIPDPEARAAAVAVLEGRKDRALALAAALL